MRIFYSIRFLILTIFFSGCAAKPSLLKNTFEPLETLSTSISVTLHSEEQSLSGSGYLVYKKPDRSHIVLLSPFGSVLMEAYSTGNQLIFLYPSEKIAFVGNFNELPEKGGLKEWKSLGWILSDVAQISSNQSILDGSMVREVNGYTEKINVVDGKIADKSKSDGEIVYYGNYANVNNVLLAHEVDLRNNKGDQLRIVLEEPEINSIIENSVFIPSLKDIKVYPFSVLNSKQ